MFWDNRDCRGLWGMLGNYYQQFHKIYSWHNIIFYNQIRSSSHISIIDSLSLSDCRTRINGRSEAHKHTCCFLKNTHQVSGGSLVERQPSVNPCCDCWLYHVASAAPVKALTHKCFWIRKVNNTKTKGWKLRWKTASRLQRRTRPSSKAHGENKGHTLWKCSTRKKNNCKNWHAQRKQR